MEIKTKEQTINNAFLNNDHSELTKNAEKLVEDLKVMRNLVEVDGQLCWKENRGWTGQNVNSLRDAILHIWKKNQSICDIAITLKKNINNSHTKKTYFVVCGNEKALLEKITSIFEGYESKIVKVFSSMNKKEYILKIVKPQERFVNNLLKQEEIIKKVNPKNELLGMMSSAKVIIPIILTLKDTGTPTITYMRCGDVYEMDGDEMSIKKWSLKKLVIGFKHLLEALQKTHVQDIFLGDIKPANILVGQKTLCFNDFSSSIKIKTAGYYEICEQKDLENDNVNQKEIGKSLDIFALGVSFCEMITKVNLFEGLIPNESFEQRKQRIKNDLEPLLKDQNQIIVRPLIHIINFMCHPDVNMRPKAAEVLKKFEETVLIHIT